MPKIKKANRIVVVEENQVDGYLKRGYDQINDKGKIVKAATGGKKISIGEYNKAMDKIKELEESTGSDEKYNELKEEYAILETENARLEKIVQQYKNNQKAQKPQR